MGFVPTILFVLSILAFGLYIFTGNQIIDDNILLLAIIIGFVGSFVMASFILSYLNEKRMAKTPSLFMPFKSLLSFLSCGMHRDE
jgi:preprotein translocase subunit SecF